MLHHLLFNFHSSRLQIKQVHFLLLHFTPFSSIPLQSSAVPTKPTTNNPSSDNCRGIAKHVISNCSHLHDNTKSLKHYFLTLSCISPETVRKFWRVRLLKPQDVLEILLGFQCGGNNFVLEPKKVESLWGIFKRASEQTKGFEHLPQSYKIMASMLVRVRLFEEVESLLSMSGTRGILLDDHEIFSDLIQGYVDELQLKKAISNYDRMRILGLVPSLSCYKVLLEFLVQLNETQLGSQIFADAIELGLGRKVAEGSIYGSVVRLLCAEGKVQDSRNLVKKVLALGIKPNDLVLNSMVTGYCEKKDYDDILSLFVEVKCLPDVYVANKIIHSLCTDFGSDCANSFRLKLEELGFCSNEITFGILIGWSCHEGKLKDAFIYFSEILSRSLEPQIYSYDSLLSGLFKQDMWKHSQEILNEMKDKAEVLHLSTLRVLLAGYCKARQFAQVKGVVVQMADCGFIQLTPLEDPLTKAFTLLGLGPSAVKIQRDSELGYSKAEFFDDLGNGLYLDTDLEKYETAMEKVLDDAMLPDFESQILNSIGSKDIKETMLMVDNMARWGQELSLPVFSTLVKGLCECRPSMKTVICLMEENPKFKYQLDQETSNKLAQAYGKKGFMHRARIIVNGMLQQHLSVENQTHTVLLLGLCKKGDRRALANYWKLAQRYNWVPGLKDGKALLRCLCQQGLLGKALGLFEAMLVHYPHKDFVAFNEFLEQLCDSGYTNSALVLVETLINHGYIPDHGTYCLLINGFCKENKFAKAFLLSETMLAKNFFLPMDACIKLIPQLCRTGNIEKAVVLKDICAKEQPSGSLYVNCALMCGFCQSGMVGEASKLCQEMQGQGLVLDKEVYNLLVQGYFQAKDFKKIGELLGVMIRRNLNLTVASYRNFLHLMCAEGKLHLALNLKEFMLKERNLPHTLIYNILIFRLFSVNKTSIVNTLVHEMKSEGLLLEEVTYNFLIQGFSRCKDVSSSLQYLKAMMQKDLRPNNRSLREVIKCLCCNGELEKALNLCEEMESRGWTLGSVIQNVILEGLLSRGNPREAVQFLDRIAMKGLIPGNINYDVLIKWFCQHGNVDKAVDLLNIMLKKGNAPDSTSFDYVIQCFCSCNMLDLALDFHTEMLCRNLRTNINTWNTLVQSLCKGGRVAEAENLLDLMFQIGEIPSREMYYTVINEYRSEKSFSKASQVLHKMQQSGHEPDFDTHWSLISNLNNSNDKNGGEKKSGFLSRFLSEVGFSRTNPNSKKG
nr:pentatricopeptide repeat-containing protein At5g15280 [Ipomoea batatas]